MIYLLGKKVWTECCLLPQTIILHFLCIIKLTVGAIKALCPVVFSTQFVSDTRRMVVISISHTMNIKQRTIYRHIYIYIIITTRLFAHKSLRFPLMRELIDQLPSLFILFACWLYLSKVTLCDLQRSEFDLPVRHPAHKGSKKRSLKSYGLSGTLLSSVKGLELEARKSPTFLLYQLPQALCTERKFCHVRVGHIRRSQWPRGLSHELFARTLGSWVWIPLKTLISVCVYFVCVLCVGRDLATGWSPFKEFHWLYIV
jgi:hypothetical protein